jgi:hypothetical protein
MPRPGGVKSGGKAGLQPAFPTPALAIPRGSALPPQGLVMAGWMTGRSCGRL